MFSFPYILNGRPYWQTAQIGTGLFGEGTAAAPSISFASDTDTGLFHSAANQIGVSIGGTAQFFLGASGSASRLYGSATAAPYLEFADLGAVSLVATGANQNITLTPSGTGRVYATSSALGSGGQVYLINATAGNMVNNAQLGIGIGKSLSSLEAFQILYNHNSTAASRQLRIGAWEDPSPSAFVITANGNTLLGTVTEGTGKLQFASATTPAGGICFGGDTYFYRESALTIGFGTTGSGTPTFHFLNNGANGYIGMNAGSGLLYQADGGGHVFKSYNTGAFRTALTVDANLNVVAGPTGAIATTATDGFLYVSACAGVPTGVPTAWSGKIPLCVDSTGGKAYIYTGGAWVALN